MRNQLRSQHKKSKRVMRVARKSIKSSKKKSRLPWRKKKIKSRDLYMRESHASSVAPNLSRAPDISALYVQTSICASFAKLRQMNILLSMPSLRLEDLRQILTSSKETQMLIKT